MVEAYISHMYTKLIKHIKSCQRWNNIQKKNVPSSETSNITKGRGGGENATTTIKYLTLGSMASSSLLMPFSLKSPNVYKLYQCGGASSNQLLPTTSANSWFFATHDSTAFTLYAQELKAAKSRASSSCT